MNNSSVGIRVSRIKKKIESYAKNSRHKIILEPVARQKIQRLRALGCYPLDILMLLEQIGCMRSWGKRGVFSREMFQQINWWTPSTIKCASAEERCTYELLDYNFENPSGLLFFAWDCDAKCYFYDITKTPWKVVVCDGVDPDSYNNNKPGVTEGWDGRVTLWEEEESGDALSVIEKWVFG